MTTAGPSVFETANGTPYLKEAGVVLLAHTILADSVRENLECFLDGFDDALGFADYVDDPTTLEDGAELTKFAGQLCYMSLGPQRTMNAEAKRYFDNIKSSGHGCYDAETDVLTEEGWKAWPDVTTEDKLATRSQSGFVEYHRPSRLVTYLHKGRMYRVDSQQVDLLVTPDHKMLVCPTTTREGRRKQDYELIPVEVLGHRSHAYVKSAEGFEPFGGVGREPEAQADRAALLGFAIGDGSINENGRQVRFHLRRERKIVWLQRLVSRLGWPLRTPSEDTYCVEIPELWLGLFRAIYTSADREKQIPLRFLLRNDRATLLGLYEGLMESDGHRGRTGDSFDTTSTTLVGQFQQLCLHLGLCANICYTYDGERRAAGGSFGTKPLTRLSVIRRCLRPEVNRFAGSDGRTSWIDGWEGDVYCAEVPNNTLYVRRNGKPVWSGNSVLEHVNFTFLIWGVSRSFTHELVRHRVGVAYSQVSQRYVNGKTLRFVERPEYQQENRLHQKFENRIDAAAQEYEALATGLTAPGRSGVPADVWEAMSKTERRKAVNQAARSCLPNETEAPIVFSGNARAMRHIIEMRSSKPAEPEIRRATFKLFEQLRACEPLLFDDYEVVSLPDGSKAVDTKWRKV